MATIPFAAFSACAPDADSLEPAPPSDPRGTWTYTIPAANEQPAFTVVLEGQETGPEADGTVSIRSLEIHRGEGTEPVQTFEGLAAEPPLEALRAETALELGDFNFDDHPDFRLLALVPAGPNVGYLHWLYRPESGRFESSPALDALPAPQFDAEQRQVTAFERATASEYRTRNYEFAGDELILVRESVQRYSEPGRYRLTVTERRDGKMELVDERQIDEN